MATIASVPGFHMHGMLATGGNTPAPPAGAPAVPPAPSELTWEGAYALAAEAVRRHDAIVKGLTRPAKVPIGILPADAGPAARAIFADALAAVRSSARAEPPARLDAVA